MVRRRVGQPSVHNFIYLLNDATPRNPPFEAKLFSNRTVRAPLLGASGWLGVDVLFPGGGGGLVGGVVVEVPVLELDAGGFEVVAVGDEAGGDGDGAVEELFGFGVGLSLALGELVVLSLGGDGEFSELALGDGWEFSADGEAVGSGGAGEAELAGSSQGAHEGGVFAAVVAEAEGGGGFVEVELVALRVVVEFGHQSADQPDGRRAEHAQPEGFDVGGSRVETELFDEFVDPGFNCEGGFGESGTSVVHGKAPAMA